MYYKFETYLGSNNPDRPSPIKLETEPNEYFKFERLSWNDKFRYKNSYAVSYFKNGEETPIGTVKFGYQGIGPVYEGDYRTIINNGWYNSLDNRTFSLGQSTDYYKNVYALGPEISKSFFEAVRDVSYNLDIFYENRSENIMIYSLLRDISSYTVKNQFHRLAHGGVEVTDYDFKFSFKSSALKENGTANISEIVFKVRPNESPQTNCHVLIGRNGVGKSYLLDRMIRSVLLDETLKEQEFYKFLDNEGEISNPFSGVTLVSFSVFDDFYDYENLNKNADILFNYIGVKRIEPISEGDNSGGKVITKDLNDLSEDFYDSIVNIKNKNIISRWEDIISYLESDQTFGTEIKIVEKMKSFWSKREITPDDKKNIEEFYQKRLSSGNKIVLLTLTKLVSVVEEKMLVVLDEPELHLHPPLMAAFNKALSHLMKNRNGVAIISTHSPVFVQETPRSAVHMMSREGHSIKIETPLRRTYGENIGDLTYDIFKLEYEKSSFVDEIRKQVEKEDDIEIIFDYFNDQLGYEARALVRQMLFEKEGRDNEQ